jgi:hypothetical protein
MKRLFLFIIVAIQGCSLMKVAPLALKGSCYISNKGPMVGNSTLLFNDSTFLYTESGGLFEGEGKWKLSSNDKLLVLDCFIRTKSGDLKLIQNRHFELRIKGRDKLACDTDLFIRSY